MKLNLLPTYVSKEKLSRTAWVFFILLCLAGVGSALGMTFFSQGKLKANKDRALSFQAKANAAKEAADYADAVILQARGIILNTNLAQAMIQHNEKYPNLYDSLLPYIPPFYRVISMQAQPVDAQNSTVTVTGTLDTYQQYADLMLALGRNPDVISVSRANFAGVSPVVPAITAEDQTARPRLPNEAPIPDDPLERLEYYRQNAQPQGYLGVGNFGTGGTDTRNAMPGASLVTVTMVVKRGLQVPAIQPTLQQHGQGAAGATPAGGTPGMGAPPGVGMTGPGGPPGMPPGPAIGGQDR